MTEITNTALPKEFLERMKNLLGDDFGAFLNSFENEPVKSVRLDPKAVSPEIFESEMRRVGAGVKKIPYAEYGYYLENFEKPGNLPFHHAGAFYVQDPAAMMPVAGVPIKEDFKILDLCASPGGKSTQAAEGLSENGFLLSNEIVPERCKILLSNLERMGIKNRAVTNADTDFLASCYRNVFDLVIADAPCSGEGMLRKNENAAIEWSVDNIGMCAERQKKILDNAAQTVRKGGYLLYSTCTYAPEENEMNVRYFLTKHPDFSLVPLSDAVNRHTSPGVGDGMEFCRRFYPHFSPGEGQFAALFVRNDAPDPVIKNCESASDRNLQPSPADRKIAEEFLKNTLGKIPDGQMIVSRRDGLYLESEILPLPEKHLFSCGIPLGEIVKGRLVPHHNFFKAYGRDFINKIVLEPDDPRVCDYLKGLEIPAPDVKNGYAAVLLEGAVLGGAKISGGAAKNHYPKGLRVRF